MDKTVLYLRGVDKDIAQRVKRAAQARGMTLSAYLTALVHLHDTIRTRADAGDEQLQAVLMSLGLATVQT